MRYFKVGIALSTLIFSMSLFGMGLGDIHVSSFLNQPFHAEIELIDVGNTPASDIKVNLASPEDFKRVGLERSYSLNMLSLSVEKQANGKPYINVTSREGLTDPFMQLLVDLSWADGQVYRAYTVLLDPPNYQLTMVKAQLHHIIRQQSESGDQEPGVIHKTVYSTVERAPGKLTSDPHGLTTYGPTLPNETIWQIAQRYKSDNFSLQQMILATVGLNPEAFTDGNLNGLKEGSRLKIPEGNTVNKVSSDLSVPEVLAHDKAWQTKGPIEHALLPPYIGTSGPVVSNQSASEGLSSYLSTVPTISHGSSSNNEADPVPIFSTVSSFFSGEKEASSEAKLDKNNTVLAKQAILKSDIDIAAAAIDSIRQSNGMLIAQLKQLQTMNKQLQKQLLESQKQIKRLRHKVRLLTIRKGTAGQTTQQPDPAKNKGSLAWVIALFELSVLLILVFFALWFKFKSKSNTEFATSKNVPSTEPIETPVFENTSLEPEPSSDISQPVVESPIVKEKKDTLVEPLKSNTDEDKGVATHPMENTSVVVEPPPFASPQAEPLVKTEEAALMKPEETEKTVEHIEPPEKISVNEKLKTSIEEPKSDGEQKISEDNNLLEFEPGIKQLVEEPIAPQKKGKTRSKAKKNPTTDEKDEHGIDFVLNPVDKVCEPKTSKPADETNLEETVKPADEITLEEAIKPAEEMNIEEASSQEANNPVKSSAALETLLALGKTYIGMEDLEAARQSLQEVVEFGNEVQRQEAQKLLDDMGKK